MPLQPEVVRRFEMDVEVRRLSVHDLYGGKICAALDRQHPRDLFDIGQLLNSTGLTEKNANSLSGLSYQPQSPHGRTVYPQFQPLADIYEREFRG